MYILYVITVGAGLCNASTVINIFRKVDRKLYTVNVADIIVVA